MALFLLILEDDPAGIDAFYHTVVPRHYGYPRVSSDDPLHTGANYGRLGNYERHGLTLHVRTHKGPVGVIMFEEGYQCRGCADELFRGDVHECNLIGAYEINASALLGRYQLADQLAVFIHGGIGLGDIILLFFHCAQIPDVIGDLLIDYVPIGRLDKSKLIDLRKGR